jgi:uroporphyrinogen-III synthase
MRVEALADAVLGMNDASGVLNGRGILVTRPAHQADALCALIEAAGGSPLRFPVLEIRPAVDAPSVQAGLARLADYDLAIFVSANAVQHTLTALAPRAWPGRVEIAAVGAATARALESRGLRVAHCPGAGFTSEALLALPAFRDMTGRRVLILRGDGGREHLRDSLIARGARVDYLEVYRRVQAQADPAPLLGRWRAGSVAAVLVASTDSLEKLAAIVGTLGLGLLRATPLIVGNARTRDRARALGLDGVVAVATDATDAAMVEALCAHFAAARRQ